MRSSPSFILGCTDDETVLLDLDNTTFSEVRELAKKLMEYWSLSGFLVLKSSEGCYHVVFDTRVSWRLNLMVVADAMLLSGSDGLKKWLVMQCRKGSSTLRVGPKSGNLVLGLSTVKAVKIR